MAGLPAGLQEGLSLLSSPSVDGICRSNVCSHPNLESDQFASEIISSMEALAHQLAFSILEDNHHPTMDDPMADLTYFPKVNYQRSIQGYPCFPYQDFRATGFAGKPVQNVSKPALSSARLLVRPGHLHLKVNGLVSPRLGSQSRGLPFRVVGSGGERFHQRVGRHGCFLTPRFAVRKLSAIGSPTFMGSFPQHKEEEEEEKWGDMLAHTVPRDSASSCPLMSPCPLSGPIDLLSSWWA